MAKVPLIGTHNKKREIEVSPGKKIMPLDPQDVPKVAIADWIPQGDNTHKAVARIHQKLIRLTQDLPAKLGLGIDYKALKRLIRAGFINGSRVAPQVYIFDLNSYFEHVEKCKADPDFWSGENLKRYMAVYW